MNSPSNLLWIVLVCVIVCAAPCLGQKTDIKGRITTGPTTSLLTMAIEDIRLDSSMNTSADSLIADSLATILKDDLNFTMYFNVVQPDSAFLALVGESRLSLDDWIYIGAQVLLKCRLSKNEGILNLKVEVIETSSNKLSYSHDFLGEFSRYRYIAHKAADDLLQNLTGETGVFFSKMTFIKEEASGSNVFVCDFDGYGPLRIAQNTGKGESISAFPAWSARGDKIYFTSYRRGNPDLYYYDFAANDVTLISSRPGLNYAAAPSPDGEFLAVVLSFESNPEIYLLDGSGKIQQQVTYSWSIDTSPTWSPNSKQIAFVSNRAGGPQIYITDSDGANTRRLTYFGDYNSDPAWSPRGDLIAFSSRENGLFQIYTIDITGQNAYKLTELGSNEAPTWSPDGLHLVYSSDIDGAYFLWVMNYDGSGNRKLPIEGNCKAPDWSVNLR